MAPNIAPFVVTDYTVTRDKYIAEQPLYANYDIDEASAVIKLSVPSLLRCSLLCSTTKNVFPLTILRSLVYVLVLDSKTQCYLQQYRLQDLNFSRSLMVSH